MELQNKSLLVSVRDDENTETSASKLKDQLEEGTMHLNVIKERLEDHVVRVFTLTQIFKIKLEIQPTYICVHIVALYH